MKWNITHGESRTNFYSRYHGIYRRCNEKKNKDYPRYGGRGIKFLWNNYEEFKKDMYPSFLVHCKKFGKKNTQIERIDVNGNYCKKNCIWTTAQEQALNRRTNQFLTVNGVTRTYVEWSRIIGCSRQALRYRVIKGLDPNLVLTLPFRHSNKYAKFI
jgi:hypothetical protein